MRVIVAGSIDFPAGTEVELLRTAKPLIDAAYEEPGCIHYVWTIDPSKPGRVWVYEEWESSETLIAHLAGEPYLRMSDHLKACGILGADVAKYRIDRMEPIYDGTGMPRGDFADAV